MAALRQRQHEIAQQLKELLRGRILDGVYPPLSRMPSENELGKAFDVSRITVRQAL
ncbi:MAG: GntR family transcriptional regulator, partial [Gemmatimonadota bacterium]|nr:GntR family transcriptional regulator [Gemmatimonadota bacterium]